MLDAGLRIYWRYNVEGSGLPMGFHKRASLHIWEMGAKGVYLPGKSVMHRSIPLAMKFVCKSHSVHDFEIREIC